MGSSCCCWSTRDLHNILPGYIPQCSALWKNHNFCLIRSFSAQLNSTAVHPSSPSSTALFAVGTHCINIFMFKHSKKLHGQPEFFCARARRLLPKKFTKKKINFSSGTQTKYLACGTERKISCLRNLVYFFLLIEFVKAPFCSTRTVTPKRIFSDDFTAQVVLGCRGCVSTTDVQELQHSVTAPKICWSQHCPYTPKHSPGFSPPPN